MNSNKHKSQRAFYLENKALDYYIFFKVIQTQPAKKQGDNVKQVEVKIKMLLKLDMKLLC